MRQALTDGAHVHADHFDEINDMIQIAEETGQSYDIAIRLNMDTPHLFLETGRALIDDAGYLVTSVVGNKTLPTGRRALLIDAGVNFLYTTTWYDLTVSPTKQHSGTWEEVGLFGPLCMNIDRIRDSVLLPNLKRGETLVLGPVGAYNVTQWMQFIEMRPNVVMISPSGEPRLIRRKETVEDINSFEIDRPS